MSTQPPSTKKTSSAPKSTTPQRNEAPRPATDNSAQRAGEGRAPQNGGAPKTNTEDRNDVDTDNDDKPSYNDALAANFDDKGDKKAERRPGDPRTRTYRDGDVRVRETRSNKDGVRTRDVVRTYPDGDVRRVTTVNNNGTIERTVSKSHTEEGDIEEVAPGFEAGRGEPEVYGPGGPSVSQEGKPGKVRVTEVERTVQAPGDKEPRTLDKFESYRQFTPAKGVSPGAAPRNVPVGYDVPPETGNATIHNGYDNVNQKVVTDSQTIPGAKFNPKGSGTTEAFTVRSFRDGEKVDETEYGKRTTLNYTTPDGQKPKIVSNFTQARKDGKDAGITQTVEMRGNKNVEPRSPNTSFNSAYRDPDVPGGSAEEADPANYNEPYQQYFDELSPEKGYKGPVDVRYSYSSTPNDKGGNTTQSFAQYGDIDEKNKPGSRTITFGGQMGGGPSQITARRVSEAEDGNGFRVQQQTNYQGTKNYTSEDTTYRPDGSFQGTQKVVKDGDTELEIERTGKPATNADVRGFASKGDPLSNQQFLARNGNAPVFQTTTKIENNGDSGPESGTTTTFTGPGGVNRLSYEEAPPEPVVPSRYGNPQGTPEPEVTTALELPGTDTPQRATSPDGKVITTDRDGNVTAESNGETVNVGKLPPGDVLNPGGSNGKAFTDIYSRLEDFADKDSETPDGFMGNDALRDSFSRLKSGGIATAQPGVPPAEGNAVEDAANAHNPVDTALGTAELLGGKLVGQAGSLNTLLSGGAKASAIVGAPLNIAAGISQIDEDPIGGGLNLVSGTAGAAGLLGGAGAFGTAFAASAWVPGLNSVAFAAGAIGLTYSLLTQDEPPDPQYTESLKF